MTLHTIPSELRLTIAELLDARTCFKFALTGRENYHLYSPLLAKYKALFARYNTIDTDGAGRLVWNVTKEIIEKPEIAQYVEDISFPNTRQSVWVPDTYLDIWKYNCPSLVPEDVVQLYVNAARKIPVMKEVLEACRYDAHYYGLNWNMEQTIRIGSDEPIAALLVAMATNLRTLRFTQFDALNEFPHMIMSVVLASMNPAKAPSLPLQNLTYASVSYADTELCCQARWAELFVSLPSLRGFAASKMGGSLESWRDGEERVNLPKSKVKDILFQYSFFEPEALEQLFSGIESLRSFTYENGGPCVSDEGCFASRRVTAALLKYAAHSLEHLTLSGDEDDDFGGVEIDHVSLRGFAKLRTLRCSWSTITGEELEDSDQDEVLPKGQFHTKESFAEGWSENLAHRLPHSLEALHLEFEPDDGHWETFVHMIRESQHLLPNLKRVHVRNRCGRSVQDLVNALNERGIVYDAEGDFAWEGYSSLAKLLLGQGEV